MDLSSEEEVALVMRKLAQRILVSATAGGVRDVETLKEQALRSLLWRRSPPAVSKPLPKERIVPVSIRGIAALKRQLADLRLEPTNAL